MIFVTVGEQVAADMVAFSHQIGDVRDHQIHAQHIFFRKDAAAVDNDDIIFVFTHLLQHFFQGGVLLRQVCDWTRLLWIYRESIDRDLLQERLEEMRLMSEWEVFATMAVDFLGCPSLALPFYRDSEIVRRRVSRAVDVIFNTGSTDDSYKKEAPTLKRKLITIWRQFLGTFTFIRIFPLDSLRFLGYFFVVGFSRTRKTTKL